ncbi:MAG: dihydrodipicolinate synthase family protein [Pirellulaceae bacterium]|nr:dihydrodipicolinate synthase family protein [Pirellulaceae bacterium]
MNHQRLTGLIAATHTPFDSHGQVNLAVIEPLAEHLIRNGVQAAFVCGSTGESHSLTVEERLQVATRWREVTRGSKLRLVVHVGSNCLTDAATLAEHAEKIGADAIAALSPSYFKPSNVETLIESMAILAGRAPGTPFYFYDIPSMTGVMLSMTRFLELAPRTIPNLVGLKFTNTDMTALQHCLRFSQAKWNILWGVDEVLLAAWALGVRGAVGSSYNFCAPLHLQAIEAMERSDWQTAQQLQYRSVHWIEILSRYGYMAAAKYVMACQGVPVGPARLPLGNLNDEAKQSLRSELEAAGFLS